MPLTGHFFGLIGIFVSMTGFQALKMVPKAALVNLFLLYLYICARFHRL